MKPIEFRKSRYRAGAGPVLLVASTMACLSSMCLIGTTCSTHNTSGNRTTCDSAVAGNVARIWIRPSICVGSPYLPPRHSPRIRPMVCGN